MTNNFILLENYLRIRPTNLRGYTKSHRDYNHLKLIADSTESFCNADRIGRLIQSDNNWSLLPTLAIFATVVPGDKLRGK